MSKTFRAWKIDEPLFLPARVGDFVGEEHLARFVLDLVRDDINLAEITGTYGSERGHAIDGAPTTTTPPAEPASAPTRVEAMRAKIKAGGHASPYRLRKQLPEPVFGQIKQARGFRQFLLRGFEMVRAEWAIVCTAHNLLKLAHRRSPSEALPMATGAG